MNKQINPETKPKRAKPKPLIATDESPLTEKDKALDTSMPQFAKDYLLKERKPYDKQLLDRKIMGFWALVWSMLVSYSVGIIIAFILMTCFVFWSNQMILFPFSEIAKKIYQMLLIVILCVGIVSIGVLMKFFRRMK